MITKIYTIRDSVVGAYLPPLMFRSRGEAIRSVTEALRDPQHQMAKHPADYTLFEIGEWDDGTAKYNLHDAPISLGNLLEFTDKDQEPSRSLTSVK